ncbi:MAG: hypothetical protein ABIC18_04780 [Candidatus Omnitrophota bacterium]
MKFIYAILIILLFAAVLFAFSWEESKGEHFIVYFAQQDKAFANQVLHKAEKDYRRIATDLGYARNSNFWTWSNRVKIYIYPSHAAFLEASGRPNWSEGIADYKNKKILSYSGSNSFLISVIPHEIAHLIFRDFVGFKGEIPLWLDEGVAQWGEEIKRELVKRLVREYLKTGALISLRDMMDLDIRLIKDKADIQLRSLSINNQSRPLAMSGGDLVDLYYIEAASLVGFLITRYGANSFTDFCRQLRDGKRLEHALASAYPNSLSGIEELEHKWIEYLRGE